MTRVLICAQHGGFGISTMAAEMYAERAGVHHVPYSFAGRQAAGWFCSEPFASWDEYVAKWPWTQGVGHAEDAPKLTPTTDIKRDDPVLLGIFDEIGQKAAGDCCKLKVVEVPDGAEWQIDEYDGLEWVAEVHRTWQ